MASIHKKGTSRIWHAYFKTWDAAAGQWKLVSKSTGTADAAAARGIAAQFERVAKMSGPGAGRVDDDADLRARVFEAVRSIVEMAGRDLSPAWVGFADEWLELRASRVKESTRRAYRTHLDNFAGWLERAGLAGLRVAAVSLPLAQRYYSETIAEGASAKTAKNNLLTLSQVMDRAVAARIAEVNPFPQVERAKGSAREREPFTLEEVRALLAACDDGARSAERARDWRTMILLGLCTGARIGDCAAMRMEWVEWSPEGDGVLGWRPIKKTDSAGRGRLVRVPLLPPLAARLRSLGWSSGPMCPSLVGCGVGNRAGLSEQFGAIVAASGIAVAVSAARGKRGILFRSKSFHSFRHTLNSLLFAADVPQEWRMRVLDHESVAVNEGYTHADVREMARWMGRLDLGEIEGPTEPDRVPTESTEGTETGAAKGRQD